MTPFVGCDRCAGARYGAGMRTHGDGYEDPAYRTTISYIDRSRIYYSGKGFEVPYRWAKHDRVPFRPMGVPLAEANVAVVTTAKMADQGDPIEGEQERDRRAAPGSVGAAQSRFRPFATNHNPLPSLTTSDLSWHKKATHTDDLGTYLPTAALQTLANRQAIGRVNDRIFGVPTVYSHRRTLSFAETVSGWCREDNVDVALLVPI